MSQKNLQTMPLNQLHKLCLIGEKQALSEWKRRWEDDYPNIREIKKMPGAATPGKKKREHPNYTTNIEVFEMSRSTEIAINDDMSISAKIEPDKVIVIVLDGIVGRAKMYDAVHHGRTIIETHGGKTSGIIFDDRERF